MAVSNKGWLIAFVLILAFFAMGGIFFLGALGYLFTDPDQFASGNVAVVRLEGGLFDAEPPVKQLQKLRKNDAVKAVVLRIDSPGGSVSTAQEIYQEVRALRAAKPVVVSMGTVAASGGYYAAAPASWIFANPGTITGSIGVRMELVNLQELAKWARVDPITLKSGRFKDMGSAFRQLTPEEKTLLQAVLDEMHRQFKAAVVESRGLAKARVEALADGRILTGEQAQAAGLVDELGSLEQAIAKAGELAGISGEPKVFYPPKERRRPIDYLLESMVQVLLERIVPALTVPRFVAG